MQEPSGYTAMIADDHEMIRTGLRAALETPGVVEPAGLTVVAEAATGLAALAAAKTHRPDLVLLDITMPQAGGGEIYHEIRRWSPASRVVIYTSVTTPTILRRLVEAEVDGMFAKGGSNALLYEKLPLILRGGRFIAPECLEAIGDQRSAVSLTPREQQTLQMILRGRSTKEIARLQGVSPRTAEKHRASLMAKLEVKSGAELMARALAEGLIGAEDLD